MARENGLSFTHSLAYLVFADECRFIVASGAEKTAWALAHQENGNQPRSFSEIIRDYSGLFCQSPA